MNSVIIDGYVTDEPKINKNEQGEATIVMFSLGNRRYVGKNADGENEYKTSYVCVKAFGFQTKRAMKVHKEDRVIVRGQLVQEKWLDREGNSRSAILVYMDELEYMKPYTKTFP